jgi:hypothetical protein
VVGFAAPDGNELVCEIDGILQRAVETKAAERIVQKR